MSPGGKTSGSPPSLCFRNCPVGVVIGQDKISKKSLNTIKESVVSRESLEEVEQDFPQVW